MERHADVIARIMGAPSVRTAVEFLFEEARRWGFTTGALGEVAPGELGRAGFFHADWPEQWRQLYVERGFVSRDITVHLAKQAIAPFVVSEALKHIKLSREQREVIEEGRPFGFVDGLCVPIHGPGSYLALAVFASDQLVLDPTARARLQLLAYLCHERCRALVAPSRRPALTSRETECLRWVAAGKSDWEISCILAISPSTAHFHIENAKRKLECRTRAQAAAIVVSVWPESSRHPV